jgi:putative redox protein
MAKKNAIVQHIRGVTFLGKADSNHWVTMDGPEEFGGSNAGSRPKELLLLALGGCTGSDVATILRKKRAPVRGLELRLQANTAEEHPQVFTDIHIEYVVYGDGITRADVERAIELSTTKYCAVSAMLKASVKLTHALRIEPASAMTP